MVLPSSAVAIPVLAAVAAAVLLCALIAVARHGWGRPVILPLIGMGVVLTGVWVGYALLSHAGAARQSAQRRLLDERRFDLARRAAAPGSLLACLNGLTGNAVEAACEAAVFATPQTVAVALVNAEARLTLLADSLAYARRFDPGYAAATTDLRHAVENDAYGLYAHVLAVRDRCTAEHCAAFAMLRDTSALRAHLREHLYDSYVAQNRSRWRVATAASSAPVSPPSALPSAVPDWAKAALMGVAAGPPKVPQTAVANAAAGSAQPVAPADTDTPAPSTGAPAERPHEIVPPIASVVPNLHYPSSDSIPPISIMDPEPAAKPATRSENKGKRSSAVRPASPAKRP